MSASSKFKQVFAKKYLRHIYDNNIRFKSATGVDRVNGRMFNSTLKENIDIIYRKVHNGTYRFSQYKENLISRGSNKYPRVISIPTIRDKLVQRALYEILAELYGKKVPLLHRVISDAIEAYNSDSYTHYIRLDVRDFYPSVQHSILSRQISKQIRKKEVLRLVRGAISQDTVSKPSGIKKWKSVGVPQGLSISNILANTYMVPVDMKHGFTDNYKYCRYVDDIIVFCNEDQVDEIREALVLDCQHLNLALHDVADNGSKSKIGEISEDFSYLGYKFCSSNISVKKETIDKLRESLIRILTIYRHSKEKDIARLIWYLNLRVTGCVFDETKYGWMFYFSQITDTSLLKQLDIFLMKQLERFGVISEREHIKKFIRTYHEITKHFSRTNYIPKFDNYTVKQKRQVLRNFFSIEQERMTEHEIEREFRHQIFRQVKDLAQDLSRLS